VGAKATGRNIYSQTSFQLFSRRMDKRSNNPETNYKLFNGVNLSIFVRSADKLQDHSKKISLQ